MKRQIVVSGIANDPSRPLVWGYVDEGAGSASRRGSLIADDSDGRKLAVGKGKA